MRQRDSSLGQPPGLLQFLRALPPELPAQRVADARCPPVQRQPGAARSRRARGGRGRGRHRLPGLHVSLLQPFLSVPSPSPPAPQVGSTMWADKLETVLLKVDGGTSCLPAACSGSGRCNDSQQGNNFLWSKGKEVLVLKMLLWGSYYWSKPPFTSREEGNQARVFLAFGFWLSQPPVTVRRWCSPCLLPSAVTLTNDRLLAFLGWRKHACCYCRKDIQDLNPLLHVSVESFPQYETSNIYFAFYTTWTGSTLNANFQGLETKSAFVLSPVLPAVQAELPVPRTFTPEQMYKRRNQCAQITQTKFYQKN